MAKILIVLACLLAAYNAAPLEEKSLLPFMSSDSAASATVTGDASSSVNANPVIVTPGSMGKKVQITITKEVGGNKHGAGHGGHAHAGHGMAQPAAAAQLHLDNGAVTIDNETVTGVLQKLLAGNIQNLQVNGQPLAVPPGGKPVAVIFSSAMHVVDIGDLQPPKVATVAAHGHHTHNHTQHAGINHTSLIESLMSPLMSLTHLGGHAQVPAMQAMQPMQMQPIVLMMPMTGQQQMASLDSTNQLQGLLQGLLSTKQQILDSALAGHHAGHGAQVATSAQLGASAQTGAGAQLAASAQVGTSAQMTGAAVQTGAAIAGTPVLAVPQSKKTKKIDVSITKTV